MAFLKIPRGKSIFIGNFAFVCKPMRAKKNVVRNLRKIQKYDWPYPYTDKSFGFK